MSAFSGIALPPEATISPATFAAPSIETSSTPIAMPSRASRRLIAAPIPAAAPVTNATFVLMTSSHPRSYCLGGLVDHPTHHALHRPGAVVRQARGLLEIGLVHHE